MYYPYLRGKQYELLALREFCSTGNNKRVWPVIEPVRNPTTNTGLGRTLRELVERSCGFTLVTNPTEGELAGVADAPAIILQYLADVEMSPADLRLAILLDGVTMGDAAAQIRSAPLWAQSEIDLIFLESTPNEADLRRLVKDLNVNLIFASEKSVARRYAGVFEGGPLQVVKLKDPFPTREVNVQYVGAPETVFTDDFRYYREDGYRGFSDYLTIGSRYREGGSAPKAVIIHLTYPTEDEGAVMIRHFASDSNDDTSDTGGKFLEAVAHLVAFVDEEQLDNPALAAFRNYLSDERFPGLGMVKKLSILNHLYVIDDLLEGTQH